MATKRKEWVGKDWHERAMREGARALGGRPKVEVDDGSGSCTSRMDGGVRVVLRSMEISRGDVQCWVTVFLRTPDEDAHIVEIAEYTLREQPTQEAWRDAIYIASDRAAHRLNRASGGLKILTLRARQKQS